MSRTDSVMLDALARCEQEFSYRFHDHLASPRPDASLTAGLAIHAGLRELYAGKSLIPFAQDAAKAAWGTGRIGDTHDLLCPTVRDVSEACTCLQQFADKPHLTLGYVHDILAIYETVWPLAQSGFDVVLNEQFVEGADGYCGTPDRVVRWRGNRQLYLHDTKTTGLWVNDAWLDQWKHKAQMAGYLDLCEQVLGEPLAGVVTDAIHIDRRGYARASDYRRTGPVDYSSALRAELRSIRHQRQDRAAELLAADPNTAPPSKNETSCFRYNKLCIFWRYCVADPADRSAMIDLDIATGRLSLRPWHPERRNT